MVHEGWVYFAGDEYITIELGVKDKPECEYNSEREGHKKIHNLLRVETGIWSELEYIRTRKVSK